MKTRFTLQILVYSLFLLAGNAVAQNDEKSHLEYNGPDAAKNTIEESTRQHLEPNGEVHSQSDYKRTHDPKGLFNKTIENIHTESKVKLNGDKNDLVKSLDSSGTSRVQTTQTKTLRKPDGGATLEIVNKDLKDPKGLMNKESSELDERVELDRNGEIIAHHLVQKVDGKVVSERKD